MARGETFGAMLKRLIDEVEGMTQSLLAEKSGLSKSFMSDVVLDRRTPPVAETEIWANILGLLGSERERFFERAAVARSKPQDRDRWYKLLDRMAQLERLVPQLEARIQQLERGTRR